MLKGNMKSLGFALAMCLVCSILLSGAASGLKPRQEENKEIDIKKNILKALAVSNDVASLDKEKVRSLYDANIKEVVVEKATGEATDMKLSELKDGDDTKLAVYQKLADGKIAAIAIPIEGKGLWSTIRGYLALEKDLNTVLGVTFYDQAETAGLGAEIAQDWFQNSFKGKKILAADGSLKSITVVKGQILDGDPETIHKVDGISGATMTTNGVNVFVQKDLESYQSYFNKVRQ